MKEEYSLLNIVRKKTAERRLSRKTENAYLNHIRRFLDFHAGSDGDAKTESQLISDFLKHLALAEHTAEATQNQALSALSFLYREVFGRKLPSGFAALKRPRPIDKTPVIFTPEEARAVLSNLRDAPFLAAALMYGSGLRISEVVSLRVGDIDFERREIIVREPQTGAKDHTTVLPDSIIPVLQKHLAKVEFLYEDDCLLGCGKTYLPNPIYRKYHNAGYEWRWQYVFPSYKLTTDEKNGAVSRYHLAESTVQKAVGEAIKKAEIIKQACCQTLRHSFAVRMFEKNYDVRRIQNLLGHKNLKTTRIYMQFAGSGGNVVQSPLDI